LYNIYNRDCLSFVENDKKFKTLFLKHFLFFCRTEIFLIKFLNLNNFLKIER